MKIKLAKRLAPYTTKKLEAEGKQQIEVALKNAGLDDMGINKCDGCEYDWLHIGVKNQTTTRYCKGKACEDIDNLDCDEDEMLGNNAEPIPNYDYDDKYKFLDEFQEGGH